MKKETKSIAEMTATPKVKSPHAPERIVGKVDTSRIYENKLSTNIKDLGEGKKVKLTILDFLQDIVQQNIDKNRNFKNGKIIVKFENTDLVANTRKMVAYATNLDIEKLTDDVLTKATISSIRNKFMRSSEKGVKVDNYAYSVSDFLKSVNASVIGKVSK